MPATCGEFAQGFLDGRDFLVTSPIDLFSEADVQLVEGDVRVVTPGEYSKVKVAVERIMAAHGRRSGAQISIRSSIPRGKGMASSSSDIGAALAAWAMAERITLPPEEISRIAVSVEPSDGIFFPGVVVYDCLRGDVLEYLGSPPPVAFVVVDCGGVVETLRYDRDRARDVARAHEVDIRRALDLIRDGFRGGSAELVAAGATLSARCHQEGFPKPFLEELLDDLSAIGGLGVNCAHSGAVLGVLFDPTRSAASDVEARVAERVGAHRIAGTFEAIANGIADAGESFGRQAGTKP